MFLGKYLIRQILVDSKNRIWVGDYDYNGVFVYVKNQNNKTIILNLRNSDDDPQTLSSDRIRYMYEDRSSNIWVGTEDGLNKLPAAKNFIQYKYFPLRETSLGGRVVSSIFEEGENYLWVGYGGSGIDRIDLNTQQITHFNSIAKNENSLSSNDISCIFEDKNGLLWIGTTYNGLNKFNPKKNIMNIPS